MIWDRQCPPAGGVFGRRVLFDRGAGRRVEPRNATWLTTEHDRRTWVDVLQDDKEPIGPGEGAFERGPGDSADGGITFARTKFAQARPSK